MLTILLKHTSLNLTPHQEKTLQKNNKIKWALPDLTIGLILLLIWMDQNFGCCNTQLLADTKFHYSPQPSLKPTILVHHCSLNFVNVSKPIFFIPNALLSKTMHISWHLLSISASVAYLTGWLHNMENILMSAFIWQSQLSYQSWDISSNILFYYIFILKTY